MIIWKISFSAIVLMLVSMLFPCCTNGLPETQERIHPAIHDDRICTFWGHWTASPRTVAYSVVLHENGDMFTYGLHSDFYTDDRFREYVAAASNAESVVEILVFISIANSNDPRIKPILKGLEHLQDLARESVRPGSTVKLYVEQP
jgi:hypothetical protein